VGDDAGCWAKAIAQIGHYHLMLYFDHSKDFGHAAVLDGYTGERDAFLVHLNMGWGGRHDGWYDLFQRFVGVRDDLQTRFLITIIPR
jgi:hypothetical protein